MLPRVARLTSGQDFTRTVRHGRRVGGRRLVVHLDAGSTGTEAPPARAGLVVSRAVGTAVTRNRVKRRLRHLLPDRLVGLPSGSRVVVRALPPAADASSAELDRDLARALAGALERARSRPSAARDRS